MAKGSSKNASPASKEPSPNKAARRGSRVLSMLPLPPAVRRLQPGASSEKHDADSTPQNPNGWITPAGTPSEEEQRKRFKERAAQMEKMEVSAERVQALVRGRSLRQSLASERGAALQADSQAGVRAFPTRAPVPESPNPLEAFLSWFCICSR